MKTLGIETSCDETSVSVINTEGNNIQVLSNVISSQVKLHQKWGGVVPNLAAREHLKNILPVLEEAFSISQTKPEQIDLISVTAGPGLIPALLIGVNAAKVLSYVWRKPLLGIHHVEGHIYANFISDKIGVDSKFQAPNSKQITKSKLQNLKNRNFAKLGFEELRAEASKGKAELWTKFPILCLVVSGGHTQLVLMRKHLDYEIIGQTLDDAVGEAFDKVARILGLGYPGGPAIARLAAQWKSQISNSKFQKNYKPQTTNHKLILPRPMINKNNFDFSFSGLKTAVLYMTKKMKDELQVTDYELLVPALCAEFQQAAIDVLIHKTLKAAEKYHPKTIMLAGGVSANQELRRQMGESIKKELKNTLYIMPDTSYSIDNAAMIAAAGYFRWQKMTTGQRKKSLCNWKTLEADANLKIG